MMPPVVVSHSEMVRYTGVGPVGDPYVTTAERRSGVAHRHPVDGFSPPRQEHTTA